MKKLSDSVIFSKLSANATLIQNMKMIASQNGIQLLNPDKDLPNEFNTIERRINYTTKGPILNAVNKGIINIYDDEAHKIVPYIPAVPGRNSVNGDLAMYVNIVRYKTRSGEIYPKTLFALLQDALIYYELQKNWNKYTNNLDLMKVSCFLYSRMTTKILDKVFALDLNEFNSDFMSFIFAKFFLVNMCERANNDLNDQIAYKCCFNRSNIEMIKDYETQLADNRFNSIFDLIESLGVISAVKGINVRTFVENYLRMYGESTLLSLDFLPAFYQSIFSAAIGGNLVKDYMFESVCGKQLINCYTIFSKIILQK